MDGLAGVPALPAAHPNTVPSASSASPGPGVLTGEPIASEDIDEYIILPALRPRTIKNPSHDPDSPVIWGRKPFPTDGENQTALRDVFALGIEPACLYNGWAYFEGVDYNIRIEPHALGSNRFGFAWAEHLLVASFLDNASAISTGSEHVLGLCFHPSREAENAEGSGEADQGLILSRPLETFYPFGRLPAEMRRMIAKLALPAPAVFYFQLHPRHIQGIAPQNSPTIRRTCSSSWRRRDPGYAANYRELARIGGFEAVCLDRHGRHPLDPNKDLVSFNLAPREDWTAAHVGASPDGVYDRFGKGLRLVAFPCDAARYPCSGPHTDDILRQVIEVSENPWNTVAAEGMGLYCDGPCKAAVCRYVSFFRDADAMYFTLKIYKRNIHTYWKRAFRKDGHVPFVAKRLLDMQKANNLDKFEDANWTWVELEEAAAATLLRPSALHAWELTRYLESFVQSLPPAARAKINPRMKFKVLVTMHQLSHSTRQKTGL